MAFDLTNFQDPDLSSDYVEYLVEHEAPDRARRLARAWDYFANPTRPLSGTVADGGGTSARPYVQAQEQGLPARITGLNRLGSRTRETNLSRKEVVIENDIAWRVQTMVDFLFGRPVRVRSLAADANLAATIEQVVATLLEDNGGVGFCQEAALYGAVYGFVDIALRTPAGGSAASGPALPIAAGRGAGGSLPADAPRRPGHLNTNAPDAGAQTENAAGPPGRARPEPRLQRALQAARMIQLEALEAPRVLPILAEDDCRRIRYWVQVYRKRPPRLARSRRPWFLPGRSHAARPEEVEVVEILGPTWWQRYEDRRLAAEGPNALGRLPVVHVQNVAQPGRYEGLSDVLPLIPLQDELNTRLSDRASRVTFQSFKMYLAKGIDDFLERPIAPGQMWATHNQDARIEEFGSDTGSPSEDAHIEQVRRAMDKVSGVTPLAAGLIEGNVGHLTSATALKVVLSGLLARTARKRLTYGAGLAGVVELALAWLDRTGALATRPDDRRIEIDWPGVLPEDESERLRNAVIKSQLGVPAGRILAELGYGPTPNEVH